MTKQTKMSSVNEILEKLHFRVQDLNVLPSEQLRDILLILNVKEILKLCEVNQKFNSVCDEELFWRIKVLNDYGIKKRYGNTWKETAIVMDKVNMINLGRTWSDGRTYREILDDTLRDGDDADDILDLQYKYILHLMNSENNEDDAKFIQIELNDEKSLQDFADEFLGKPYTADEIDDILLANSKEMKIIYASVLTYKGMTPCKYLPGNTIGNSVTTGTALQSYEFLRKMIDPVLYVMQFSSFSRDRLNLVEY